MLQAKFDFRLISILAMVILNFLCILAIEDKGNPEST